MIYDFLIGSLAGLILLFLVTFFSYRSDLMYDFRGWWKKHSKGFLIATFIVFILGGVFVGLDNNESLGCRDFGRYASSC
jgi:hypothetical protein